MSSVTKKSLYFSLLPSELLRLLFYFFNSTELLDILPKLESNPDFSHLFSSRIFWEHIWRRDISSFLSIPDDPYIKYRQIFETLKIFGGSSGSKSDRIEYLATRGYDKLLFSLITPDYYDVAMIAAASGGHTELVKKFSDLGARYYNLALVEAAHGGYMDIVELLLKLGATDYNGAMAYASFMGHKEIVERMLGLGATDYDRSLGTAASGGQLEIVQMMLDLGATNYDQAIRSVSMGSENRYEIIELIKSYQYT